MSFGEKLRDVSVGPTAAVNDGFERQNRVHKHETGKAYPDYDPYLLLYFGLMARFPYDDVCFAFDFDALFFERFIFPFFPKTH